MNIFITIHSRIRAILHITPIVLIICFTAVLSIHPIDSEDIFSNIVTGSYILDQKMLPSSDPFSFTGPFPWKYHWPVAPVIIALVYHAFHIPGVIVFFTLLLVATYTMLYLLIKKRTTHLVGFLATMYAIAASAYWFSTRKYVFGFLFEAIYLWFLLTIQGPLLLLLLIPLQLIWGYTHQSALLGPGMVGIWFGVKLFQNIIQKKTKKDIQKSDVLLCIGITLAAILPAISSGNILGYLRNIYGPLSSRTYISEWLPVTDPTIFFSSRAFLFFLSLVLLLALLIHHIWKLKQQKADQKILFLFLISVFLAVVAFQSSRMIPFYYIPWSIIAAQLLFSIPFIASFLTRMAWPICMVSAIGIGILGVRGYDAGGARRTLSFDIAPWFAQKHINLIKKSEVQGTIFTPYDLGSYALFSLYPKHNVYIDGGRLDEVYGEAFFRHYREIMTDPTKFISELSLYNVEAVILQMPDPGGIPSPVLIALSNNQEWSIALFDDYAILFIRKDVATRLSIPTLTALSPIKTPVPGQASSSDVPILSSFPGSFHQQILLEVLLMSQGKTHTQVVSSLQSYCEKQDTRMCWYQLGRQLLFLGAYTEAQSTIQNFLPTWWATAGELTLAGDIARANKQFDLAKRYYQDALSRSATKEDGAVLKNIIQSLPAESL